MITIRYNFSIIQIIANLYACNEALRNDNWEGDDFVSEGMATIAVTT